VRSVASAASLRGLPLLACNTHVEKWKPARANTHDRISSSEMHLDILDVTLRGIMNNVDLMQRISQLNRVTRLPFPNLSSNLIRHELIHVTFEVFTAVTMKNGVFWDVNAVWFL
jgi:hypothetical protein